MWVFHKVNSSYISIVDTYMQWEAHCIAFLAKHFEPIFAALDNYTQWLAGHQYRHLIIVLNPSKKSPSLETFYWSTLFFQYYIGIICVFAFFKAYAYLSSKHTGSTNSSYDSYLSSYSLLEDLEEEFSSLDDILYYILIFVVVIFWFYLFVLFAPYIYTRHQFSWVLATFFMVILTGLIVPCGVLKAFGAAFVKFVRGAGRTNSLIFETLLDFVSVSVLFIRFFIQNIRYGIVFLAFFELYEYVYELIQYHNELLLIPQLNWTNLKHGMFAYCGTISFVLHVIVQIIQMLYYVGHLTLVFVVQLSIYFALSIWLFYFLYTTFVLETHEKYFFFYKYVLNKHINFKQV